VDPVEQVGRNETRASASDDRNPHLSNLRTSCRA
jgi:hypothetical protein